MYKMIGKARKGRETEERQENLSRSEKGGNRAGSIGGNPSGRVSRFTEHEILPVSSLHRPAPKSGPLSFPARSTHTRTRVTRVSALRGVHVHVRATASSSSALIAPYPPSRAERGDTRLDSSQLHRRFTIQFHLPSVPAPRSRNSTYRLSICFSPRRLKENFGGSSTIGSTLHLDANAGE